jgi:hypothetical protein
VIAGSGSRSGSISSLTALVIALALFAPLGGNINAMAASAAVPPDLSGFWAPATKFATLRTSKGEAPPLTATARKIYEARLAASKSGDNSWDNTRQCLPMGIPRLLGESAFELAQNSTTILFLYEWNRLQRPAQLRKQRVPFDTVYPYYLGHPMAWWEANTLVVDSVDFHDDVSLDSSGLPHTNALRIVERYTLKDADTLVATVRIEDSGAFTKPWETGFSFKRMKGIQQLPEDVCEDRTGLQNINTQRNKGVSGAR